MSYLRNYEQTTAASLSQSTITASTPATAQTIGGRIDCSKYSKVRVFFKIAGIENGKKLSYTSTCSYSDGGQLYGKDGFYNITSILPSNFFSITNGSTSTTIYNSPVFDVAGIYDLQLYGYTDDGSITVDTTYILYNE